MPLGVSVGVRAIVLDEDDALVTAQILSSNTQELSMASSKGLCIRFGIEEVRQIGRVARGVIGMRLRAGR